MDAIHNTTLPDAQLPEAEALPPMGQVSVSDYDALPEGAPYQLIDRKRVMHPAPDHPHRSCASKVHLILSQYLAANQLGKVLMAPLRGPFAETIGFSVMYLSGLSLKIGRIFEDLDWFEGDA